MYNTPLRPHLKIQQLVTFSWVIGLYADNTAKMKIMKDRKKFKENKEIPIKSSVFIQKGVEKNNL